MFSTMKMKVLVLVVSILIAVVVFAGKPAETGALVVNGWYEGEEIYYLDLGVEEGVHDRGENDLFAIGAPRKYQANVVEFIPGEAGYSPHWNIHFVHTAEGVVLNDILASDYVSDLYEEEGVLFDDVEDIWGAAEDGLVTVDRLGVVVLCPVVSEETADAPGNREAPEDFPPFEDTF